jgi:hypothetical protein
MQLGELLLDPEFAQFEVFEQKPVGRGPGHFFGNAAFEASMLGLQRAKV